MGYPNDLKLVIVNDSSSTGSRSARQQRVLKDHKRLGRRYVPPLATLDFLSPLPWRTIVPEIVWIACLHLHWGEERGAELTVSMVAAADKVEAARGGGLDEALSGIAMSWYAQRSEEELRLIASSLNKNDLADILEALFPLLTLYDACPLQFLRVSSQVPSGDEALEAMTRVLWELIDRRSRLSTICQASVLYALAVNDRLRFAEESRRVIEVFPAVELYPATDDSKEAAAYIRSLTTALFGFASEMEWPKSFWRRGMDISTCRYVGFRGLTHAGRDFYIALEAAAKGLAVGLPNELQHFWENCDLQIEEPLRGEVIGGLLGRQHRLLGLMLRNPQLWSSDIGRVLLRCMTETYLTISWIVDGDAQRLRSYVEHGLGQEKLLLEHLQVRIREDDREDLKDQAEEIESWINSQLITPLVPVDIGSWLNVRQTAHELGEDDLYDLQYSPFSSAVHSSWNAVARYDLDICVNPLHGVHRTPNFGPQTLDGTLLLASVDMFEASFHKFADSMRLAALQLESLGVFDEAVRAAGERVSKDDASFEEP